MTSKKPSAFRDRINEFYKTQGSLNVKDIEYEADLTSLLGLLALLRTWSSEKLDHIQPLDSLHNILCPTSSMTRETISKIYRSKLVNIDASNSPDSAFVENEDHSISWYIFLTALQPSLCTSDRVLDIQETIALLQGIIPNCLQPWQKSQLPDLMRTIAVEECVQYLQYILSEYGFDEPVGEKTKLIFDELLDSLPVSCIIPCIWSSAKSAAAFLQTPACKGRKHAFNTIQGKIRETASKRLSGELQNKPFVRSTSCGRSQISIELYSLLGFDGDVGFNERLADIEIPEAWKTEDEDNEYETGAKFTTHEKLVLEECGYYECSDSWFERPLTFLDREVVVRKVLTSPCYEVRVKDVSNLKDSIQIASAWMDDFTSVAIFIDAMEKSDDIIQLKQKTDANEEE
ncbi:MAG: hypothetical protein WCT35_09735 [Sideroxydans sp.]